MNLGLNIFTASLGTVKIIFPFIFNLSLIFFNAVSKFCIGSNINDIKLHSANHIKSYFISFSGQFKKRFSVPIGPRQNV